jgi:hypothetical protein
MMPERAFFLHLMRTGGTALKGRLRRAVGDDALYPPVQNLKVDAVRVDRLTEQYAAGRHHLRVVSGHFPLCVVELLGDPFSTFTILRDPVERSLSHLRRRGLRFPERYEGRGLEEIYDDPWVQVTISNHMVKMLSLTVDEMSSEPLIQRVTFDDDRLRRAKHNLEQMDVLGVPEEVEDFCAALEARFGWDLGPPLFANQTDPIPVPDSLRKRLVEDNQLDIELFQHARDLLATARRARPRQWRRRLR